MAQNNKTMLLYKEQKKQESDTYNIIKTSLKKVFFFIIYITDMMCFLSNL